MQQAVNSVNSVDTQSDEAEQYLTFMLSSKAYGLDILNIKEIIEYGDLTEVPMTPDFISGVINLRGSVVPVIDLSQRFSGAVTEHTKRTSIIILEVKNDDLMIEIGVTVDMVNEVLDIHPSEIEPPPALGNQIQTNFISGMAKVDGHFLILLDIENILSIDELSMVGSMQREEG
ncbi:MAG: chemotaxis protein CheW [Gammaproteobacteria bacterium]|nr:chemotaxis protein CheW [Gammaproteobacteria bacterium]